jgi:hypothetical protein
MFIVLSGCTTSLPEAKTELYQKQWQNYRRTRSFLTPTVLVETMNTTTTTSPAPQSASFLDISDFGNNTSQAASAAEISSETGGVYGWVAARGVLDGITIISLIGALASY